MRAQLFGAQSPVVVKRSPYVSMSYHVRMSLAGLLLFVLAGTGTVSAAQGALPGDLLYPVKININETVKVALAPTPAAKAQLHAELADARVEEAQTLAVQGRLDAPITQELADNFDKHARHAQEFARSVEESDPAASVQITTQLDSAFAANGAVLRALGSESSSTETKRGSERFAARVLGHVGAQGRIAIADAASKSGRTAEAQITALSAPAQNEVPTTAPASALGGEQRFENSGEAKAVLSLETKASEVLASARTRFAEASTTLDATTTLQLARQFADIDALIAQGSSSLRAGDSASAMADFTAALSKSSQLRAVLKAQIKFDNGILKPLLQFGDRDSGDGD